MTGILLPPEFELFGPEDVESIDWADPVSDDPLNDGLEMWMLAGQGIPGGFGGDQWVDLTRKHVGTLTSMDPATDWQGTSRAGGFGALDFDGSNDYVAINRAVVTAIPLTISAWVKRAETSTEHCHVQITDASDVGNYFQLGSHPSRGWEYQVRAGGSFDSTNFAAANGGSATTEWVNLTAVSESQSIHKIYLDGSLLDTDTNSSTPANLDYTAIGAARDSSPGFYTSGVIDDIRIYNRALSATEVSGLYHQSKESYPDLLNRYTTSRYRVPAAGGSSILPLMNHYLIG